MFKERLLQELRTTFRYWRSMIDGVMLLYIAVPAILFSFYFLRETVFQLQYGLLERISSVIVVMALLLASTLLRHRYFIQSADRLFFIQYEHAFSRIKRYAFLYSYIKNVLLLAIPYSLLVPYFLYVQKMAIFQLIELALGMLTLLLLAELVQYIQRRWQQVLVLYSSLALCAYAVYAPAYSIAITLLIGCSIAFSFNRHMLGSVRYFEKQVALEYEASMTMQKMMIRLNPQFTGVLLEPFHKRKPRLWRRPYAHTPIGAICELVLKTCWRQQKLLLKLGQLFTVTLGLLFALPAWGAIFLLPIFTWALKQSIQSIVLQIRDEPFAQLFPTDTALWLQAAQSIWRYSLPAPMIIFISVLCLKLWFL